MSRLEVIDRRKQKAEDEAAMSMEPPEQLAAVEEETYDPAAPRTWKEKTSFMVTLMGLGNGVNVITGRAVNVRNDGLSCASIVILNSIWEEDTAAPNSGDWQSEALSRLESFLLCGCRPSGARCKYHSAALQGWIEEGIQRVRGTMSKPVPPAIKALIEAEKREAALIQAPKPNVMPSGLRNILDRKRI